MELLAPAAYSEEVVALAHSKEVVAPAAEELLASAAESAHSEEVLAPAGQEVLASAPNSDEVLAPAAEEDSEELLAPDSEVLTPAAEEDSEEVLAPVSQEVLAPASQEVLASAPDSEEVLAPTPNSETTVPDSMPPGAFLCPRCLQVHEDRESWDRAHSRLRPCLFCGLIHSDYWIGSNLRYDDFDCTAALDMKRKREEEDREWRKKNIK
ncbi:unnamed protein product [Urochloa humidicola]